jgi:hypothetical protein
MTLDRNRLSPGSPSAAHLQLRKLILPPPRHVRDLFCHRARGLPRARCQHCWRPGDAAWRCDSTAGIATGRPTVAGVPTRSPASLRYESIRRCVSALDRTEQCCGVCLPILAEEESAPCSFASRPVVSTAPLEMDLAIHTMQDGACRITRYTCRVSRLPWGRLKPAAWQHPFPVRRVPRSVARSRAAAWAHLPPSTPHERHWSGALPARKP